MRRIERTTKFKKDFKRELKGKHKAILQDEMIKVLSLLVNDKELEARYFDHSLSNNWKEHRDCHIRPDLLLIYKNIGNEVIQLVRIGSHSEIGF